MPSRTRYSRRAFIELMCGATGALLLSACSSAASPTASPNEKPSEPSKTSEGATPQAQTAPSGNQVTIRYGTFWPEYRLDIMAGPLKAWMEANPNIKVELESAGAQYRDKLTTQMAGGTAADSGICDVWAHMRYVDLGHVQELTDYVKRDGIDIAQESWLMGYEILAGKVFAMPWVLSPHCWYYNKTMLQQAGAKDPWDDFNGEWTWADFKEMLVKVSQLPKKDGQVTIYGARLGMNNLEYQLGGFIYSNGGSNYTLEPFQYTLDDPKLIEAVEFVIDDLYHQNKLILPPDEQEALSQGGVTDPFSAGIVGFMEDSTGRLTITRDSVKDAFEWDIAPIPRASANSGPKRGAFAADANFVYAKGQNRDQAYEVLKFFSGYSDPSMQVTLAQNKLLLQSNKKAAREYFVTPPPAHVDAFVTGLFVGHFLHHKGNEANRLIQSELDKAILGEQSVKDTLLKLNTELNSNVLEPPKNKQLDTFQYNFSN